MHKAMAGWVNASLVSGALAASLLFNGIQIQYYYLALVLLTIWLLISLLQAYKTGFHLPQTGLMLLVTLFWAWLGVTLAWNPVPLVGMNYFWLVGCLPLTLWIFTISNNQQTLWRYSAYLILLIGLSLAIWAVFQFLVQQQMPRSAFLDINSHASFLNLIALPASAYFLLLKNGACHSAAAKTAEESGSVRPDPSLTLRMTSTRLNRVNLKMVLLGAILFILFFAIALTKGRAAILSFSLGMGLIIWLSARHTARRNLIILLALAASAFVLANLIWAGGVTGRLQTIFNPASAGSDRFIIWENAWKMYLQAPWLGFGLGTFWLAWPPYRHPLDASGGYYVHNDYLQIAIETGLPGLLLWLAVLLAALWLFIRVIRNTGTASRTRIEITGLMAGLFAIAAQSFFNFNLYIMPTLILAGLVLARFQQLAMANLALDVTVLNPNRWLRKRLYYTLAPLLVLFMLGYFVMQALADHYYGKALMQANQGRLEAADDSLAYAMRLSPLADNVLNTRADLLRHLLSGLTTAAPDTSQNHKKVLYDAALELLYRAEALNPLRPDIIFTRAKLYEANPALAGPNWLQLTEDAYKKALKIDPRFYRARHAYGQLLIAQNNIPAAQTLLEDGMKHSYFPQPKLLPYYVLTANLRLYLHETKQANALKQEIDIIVKTQGLDKETLELINQSRITATVSQA